MALTYFEISYPNFVLGAIIDPEEANQNNYEIVTKINSVISAININEDKITNLTSIKSDVTYVDTKISGLAGVGRTTETIKQNAANLITHKTSTDHDGRYYVKTEVDTKLSVLATKSEVSLKANSIDVYTKSELQPWLQGGDTNRKEEVFTIINPNLGNGTFSYSTNGQTVIGQLTPEGYQVFNLTKGYYNVNSSRIEVIINDTLRRSVVSGGIIETSNTSFALVATEGAGAEITVIYYERLGFSAEYNLKMAANKPPQNDGKTMWIKIIG